MWSGELRLLLRFSFPLSGRLGLYVSDGGGHRHQTVEVTLRAQKHEATKPASIRRCALSGVAATLGTLSTCKLKIFMWHIF